MFMHCKGNELRPDKGYSFFNKVEAEKIVKILKFLIFKGNIEVTRIGVISAYKGQKNHIRKLLRSKTRKNQNSENSENSQNLTHQQVRYLEIASIDAFQGREKDFILISTVRSNKYQNLGFLNDFRRLNVSITRAKQGLIIVGDAHVLVKDKHWRALLKSYHTRKVLVQDISSPEDKNFSLKTMEFREFGKQRQEEDYVE